MAKDNVFISYSHLDKKWLSEVKKALGLFVHTEQIIVWDDTMIKVGSNWNNDIMNSINNSRVAILLVSTNFLNSEFIIKNELPRVLKAANKKNGLTIFNILVDICAFKYTELKAFQFLNETEQPLEDVKNSDKKKILLKLTDSIHKILQPPPPVTTAKLCEDDLSPFCLPIILASLVKIGSLPITEIQNKSGIRRKVLMDGLDALKKLGYAEKLNGEYNKKPSSLWKASELGINIFKQFETSFAKIVS